LMASVSQGCGWKEKEEDEIAGLKNSVEELRQMLEDQANHRVGVERHIHERCDRLDAEMALLNSQSRFPSSIASLQDRLHAFENGFGAETEKTMRELETLQANYLGLRKELDAAMHAVHGYATAIEVIEGSLQDVASKADEADETHKKFVGKLQASLNDAFERLDGSVKEALMVTDARLDETNTRLDNCERQSAELTGRSSSPLFADREGKMEGLHDAMQNLKATLISKVALSQSTTTDDGIESLQKTVRGCQTHCDKLEEQCMSLVESVCALKRQVQDSGENGSDHLEAVKAHVKDLHDVLDGHHRRLTDLIADETRARVIEHGAVHDRLDALDRRHNDSEGLTQEFGHHKGHIEAALQNLALNTAHELKSSRDDIEQVHGLIQSVHRAWGTKVKGLRTKKHHSNQRQPLMLLPAEFLTP